MIGLFQGISDRAVIFIGTADRLFENRWIRSDPFDAVGVDQLLEVALDDEAAGQEIQPDRLPMVFKFFDGIHDALCSGLSESLFGCRAASGGKPNVSVPSREYAHAAE